MEKALKGIAQFVCGAAVLAAVVALGAAGLAAEHTLADGAQKLISGMFMSAEAAPKKHESLHAEYCDAGRSLVELIASDRDRGVPRSFALAQVEEDDASREAKDAVREIVEAVYKADSLSPRAAGRAFMEGCMQGIEKPARAKVSS